MGVPLLAMPARESRAEERVVGLKSTGITSEGRLGLRSAWWQTGEKAGGEEVTGRDQRKLTAPWIQ